MQQRRPRWAPGARGRTRRIGIEQREDGISIRRSRRLVDGHTR
jgi:hypothetical protein